MRGKGGKELIGRVVSAKMAKTVIVVVNRLFRHPLYKKAIRRTKRFLAHNEGLTLSAGDRVKIKEVRPISKNKHFVVKEKLS
ncbi:MAG: 30S ribosomal protein S17 [Patescibacteria group bacterium]